MTWPDRLAGALGEAALTDEEVELLLDLARDVAHGTERRYAPLSTFLVGVALGRRGEGRGTAELERLVGEATRLLHDEGG